MLVSKNWLSEFVTLPKSVSDKDLGLKLTLSTVEIEGMKKQGENLDQIILGEIVKISQHPNADKLKVVDTKIALNKIISIICGGINIKEGMKVAVALPGTKVRWHGQSDFVELKEAEIRGVKSHGMICASNEIGLEEMFPASERVILDLSLFTGAVGMPLSKILELDDTIYEIDNKSITHRSDLWGHYGLAREVSVLYGKKLSNFSIPQIKKGAGWKLDVFVKNKKQTPRYIAVVLDGIKIAPSPAWMQKRLFSCGLRPINNIVDITNYVMLELGQPMHAFDAKKVLAGKNASTIIVRNAKLGEKMLTLDHTICTLSENDLVIADKKNPIALAGIIGGEKTAVDESTTTIIFESANFNGAAIRKSALHHGIRTESSSRFEKDLDSVNTETALRRAVQLALQLCRGARVVSRARDIKNFSIKRPTINITHEFLVKKIGLEIPLPQTKKILSNLGFKADFKKSKIQISVPSWRRKDIKISEDVVEEISRIYGYQKITATLPKFSIQVPRKNNLRILERKIKNFLSHSFGYTEVSHYSFVSESEISKIGWKSKDHIKLLNPISEEYPFLRQSLLPGLLGSIEKNLSYYDKLFLYEIGTIFSPQQEGFKESPGGRNLPLQALQLYIVCTKKEEKNPFNYISSTMSALFDFLGYSIRYEIPNEQIQYLHPYRQADIYVNNQKVGFFGEVLTQFSENFGINERVSAGKVDLNKLIQIAPRGTTYQAILTFPPALRDIAFLVDEKIALRTIVDAILVAHQLIREAELFDIYRGKNISDGKKSLAFHVVYQSMDHTLTSQEVEKAHQQLVNILQQKFNAQVR